MQIPARALHYVLKIGDRGKNSFFFRKILGMKVLRHEEFKQGCEAECNGPYDNRWSKTMVGYGPESNHFVIELTYNYGVKSYALGNDFGGVIIQSSKILERARNNKYPITTEKNKNILISPDGYKFYIVDEPESENSDPVVGVTIHSSNLAESKKFWNGILSMKISKEDDKSIILTYGMEQATLSIKTIADKLDRAEAYGRIAFAVPRDILPKISENVRNAKGTILKDLIKLDTPGKASVHVVILADPDGHEICFVDTEGFSELSEVEPDAEKNLDKFIAKDPFEDKE